MLSIYNIGGGVEAGNYYEKTDDYYTKDRSPSSWQGKGAEALNLHGEVKIEDFRKLLDGNLPNGETIQVASEGRRGGSDLTFSAPKSVSMQALIGGDLRLVDAHDKAVAETLKYAETLMAYRQTRDGETKRVFSGNLIAATFRHELSRACDPELHTHSAILNATQREDGKWRAMDNEIFYNQKMLMGAMYRACYAREIQKLGYEIRITREDGLFELARIDDKQIDSYSQRSQAIEELLAQNGKTRETATAREKQIATIATRPQKNDVDREVLREYWLEKSRELGLEFKVPEKPPSGAAAMHFEERFNRFATSEAVQFAVQHLTERQSVVTESKIVRKALEAGIGKTTYPEIKSEIERRIQSGDLIQSTYSNSYKDFRFTTPEALNREKNILAFEEKGRKKSTPPIAKEEIHPFLNGRGLNDGQRQACELILASNNQVVGIQGLAGTGKTFMLRAAREIAEKQGYQLVGVAPSASAARELGDTGIPSKTITSFQATKDKGLSGKSILVVDEAGMTSAKQMESLLKTAERYGSRVVLVGDTQQLKSVEAGRPFAQLQAHGMEIARMGEIVRQKGNLELMGIVELAAAGNVRQAVALMEKQIVEIPSDHTRYARIAQDYVNIPEQSRQGTLIVSGTNEARKEINDRVRDGLGFKGHGVEIEVLNKKDLTDAELKRAESYRVGDLVKPEKDYKQLKKDEVYKISAVNRKILVIEKSDGSKIHWDPERKSKLSVYNLEKREITRGETLRITENDSKKGIVNGERVKVLDIERGKLKLEQENGQSFELSTSKPLRLEHGYCSTVHSAQGKTCERVLIEANTRSVTSAQDNFYVAISRAEHEAKIYTNDKAKLPEAMSRKMDKEVALDLNRPMEKQTVRPMELKTREPQLQQAPKAHVVEKDFGLDR